ncbi:hypothetical protein M405DRAFT_809255 [Rhizopogon salebrosus TDB-379]|nr:hypothetical protein M405DRAFT_809255 [Rhizopogon salebrosus TDB-379]
MLSVACSPRVKVSCTQMMYDLPSPHIKYWMPYVRIRLPSQFHLSISLKFKSRSVKALVLFCASPR